MKRRILIVCLILAGLLAAGFQLPHRRLHFRSSGAWTPPAGMVAWWYGDSVVDRTGGGKNLTLGGGATTSENGIVFTTVNLDTAKQSSITFGANGEFSVCAWVNYSGAAYTGGYVGIATLISGALAGWSIYVHSDTSLRSYVNTHRTSTLTVPVSTWVHVAMTYKDGTLKLHKNGGTPQEWTGVTYAAATGFAVGNFYYESFSAGEWLGTIDDTMVFSVALSQAQLADIIANSPGKH